VGIAKEKGKLVGELVEILGVARAPPSNETSGTEPNIIQWEWNKTF